MNPDKKKRILLVDDSPTVILLEQMILQDEPYELHVAQDGLEALAKAAEQNPDLILLDVVMPKMDGFHVCRRLRESAATAMTPILMVTTRSEPGHIEQGYEAGCTDYIHKPLNGAELLAKVRDYLQ